jgi:hypothetical protein
MDTAARRALERLRDPSGDALRQLARLVVDEATETPLKDLAAPRWIAGQVATALEAVSQGDVARRWVADKIAEGRDALKDETRPARAWLPPEAEKPLRDVLSRPWSPDEQLTLQVIDQPAMRNLVREVLEETLTRFQRRLRSLDKSGVGSLGMRAARKAGRSFLGGLGENLGGLTENLVGAVTEELEHVLQDRIKEFVATATGEAIKSIARHFSDPRYAQSFGELRVSALDVLLDAPVNKLAAEGDKLKPEELVDVVIATIRSTISAPDFVDTTEARVAKVLETAGDGTLGAWLDEVGLRAVWADTTTELVSQRLVAVVKTEKFESWWAALFAE